MSLQIKKPSCEDGLGNAISNSDFSISPESFVKHIHWNFLSSDEVKLAKSPEIQFPIDALPAVMREAVEEAVDVNQCPIPIAVAVALGAFSASAQTHFDVSRDESHTSPLSLSLITIAESGERKTSTDKLFSAPFHDWELAQRKQYTAELDVYSNKQKAYDFATREVGKGDKNPETLYRKLNSMEAPIKPIQRSILQDRVTMEKLFSNLAGYPVAYLNSNEAGALLGSYAFKSENFQSAITTLNQLWDGAQLKHDTKGGNLILIPKPRVTVNLLLQESIYNNFSDGNDGLAFSTGGLSRFLICQPESRIGTRPFKKAPKGLPAIAQFNQLISQLLAKPANLVDGILQTKRLTFTDEAFMAWIEYHDQIERELGNGGELYMIRGWGAKAAEQVCRVAANFQIATYPNSEVVELDAVLKAIRVVSYYLNESLRLAHSSKSRELTRVLNWLINRLQKKSTQYMLRYQIQQFIHNDLRSSEKIEDALLALEESGYIHCTRIGDKDYVFINPHFMVMQ
jgi:hypothetical protein